MVYRAKAWLVRFLVATFGSPTAKTVFWQDWARQVSNSTIAQLPEQQISRRCQIWSSQGPIGNPKLVQFVGDYFPKMPSNDAWPGALSVNLSVCYVPKKLPIKRLPRSPECPIFWVLFSKHDFQPKGVAWSPA